MSSAPRVPWLAALLAVSVVVASGALCAHRLAAPAPLGLDAPSGTFSSARAARYLAGVLGDESPHPTGSAAHAAVRARIVQELAGMGYEPALQEGFACSDYGICDRVTNIVAELEGTAPAQRILLAAHYDSVDVSPGAADDGAGIAALLEVARTLRAEPRPRNSIVFLFDDGEESGMLGARLFARQHPLAPSIRAVVNLEAKGVRGPSLLFETVENDAWLIEHVSSVVDRPVASSLFVQVYRLMTADTSLTVLERQGRDGSSGVNLAFIGGGAYYHTQLDSLANLDRGSLQHHGDNALAIARALGAVDIARTSEGDAVFFDVLALVLVWWPAALSLPLAAVATLGLALAMALAARRGELSVRGYAWGFTAYLVYLAVCALALAMAAGLGASGSFTGLFSPAPGPSHAAFLLPGLALPAIVAGLVRRRARAIEIWSSIWTVWALLALALAVLAPGLSYLFLIPCLLAATGGLLYSWSSLRAPVTRMAVLLACVGGASLLWWPPVWLLHDALGTDAFPVMCASLALLSLPLSAAFVPLSRRASWLFAGACLAGSAIALSLTALEPPFSRAMPQPLNIHVHHAADLRATQVFLNAYGAPISSELSAMAADTGRAFPWWPRQVRLQQVTSLSLPGPELEIAGEHRSDGQRRITLRLRSARGARIMRLHIAPQVPLMGVSIAGHPVPAIKPRLITESQGWRSYTCNTVPPEGLEMEVTVAGDEPVDAVLVDMTQDLPAGLEPWGQARSHETVPFREGDVTHVSRQVRF